MSISAHDKQKSIPLLLLNVDSQARRWTYSCKTMRMKHIGWKSGKLKWKSFVLAVKSAHFQRHLLCCKILVKYSTELQGTDFLFHHGFSKILLNDSATGELMDSPCVSFPFEYLNQMDNMERKTNLIHHFDCNRLMNFFIKILFFSFFL